MSRLIEIVDLKDNRGYTIGRRLKYACDICGADAYRSIRMESRRVLCFKCRQEQYKAKRLGIKVNTKPEGE